VGSQCGQKVWALARTYFDGSVTNTPVGLTVQPAASGFCVLRYSTLRGLFYGVQSTADLSQPFTNEPAGIFQAIDSSIALTNPATGPQRFYRIKRSLTP
jgi:hypothetical protein